MAEDLSWHNVLSVAQRPYADPEGGGGAGGPDPPGKLQKYGFLSNSGPDPVKITKLSIQHSMLCHHWPTSETQFN